MRSNSFLRHGSKTVGGRCAKHPSGRFGDHSRPLVERRLLFQKGRHVTPFPTFERVKKHSAAASYEKNEKFPFHLES